MRQDEDTIAVIMAIEKKMSVLNVNIDTDKTFCKLFCHKASVYYVKIRYLLIPYENK